ncbi:MAG: PEGA domain-containing protein [Deltaproteobacteria bacterium]|nr:PEGA domain-containing protein [Deltaproteobacteria bacterium]
MSRSTIGASTILTVILLVAAPVRAQGDLPATAKESFDQGVKLFTKNDYKGALAEFLSAHELKPHYSVLYNIAQCYAMTDAHAKALDAYKKYISQGSDYIKKQRKKQVEKEIERLEGLLCRLTLDITPDGVLVTVDGTEAGTSPLDENLFLDPGKHTFVFEKQGHVSRKQTLILKRDEDKSLTVELEEKKVVTPVVEPAPDEPAEDEPPVEDEKPPATRKSPAGFYALLGTTAALGITSAVLGGVTLKKGKDFEKFTESEEDDWKPAQEDGRKLAIATDVILGLTGAAAVATIVMGVITFKKDKKEKQAVISPLLLPGGAGIAVTGGF